MQELARAKQLQVITHKKQCCVQSCMQAGRPTYKTHTKSVTQSVIADEVYKLHDMTPVKSTQKTEVN